MSHCNSTDALTGYEIVPATSPDYNYVPNHWYYRFAPRPKPGSHCDPHTFTIGDSFVTNNNILVYQLTDVLGTAASTVDYKGTPLQDCDVSSMSAISDARFRTSTIAAAIACTNETGFPVIFSTSFVSSWFLPGSTSGSRLDSTIGNLVSPSDLALNVSSGLFAAGEDLFNYVNSMYNDTRLAQLSVSTGSGTGASGYPPWWCSVTNSSVNATCETAIPQIPLGLALVLDANGNFLSNDLDLTGIPGNYTLAITNAMQVMLAAVRIDLGNILPTNMFVNRSLELINATIASTFTADQSLVAELYATLSATDTPAAEEANQYRPITIGDAEKSPSHIDVGYQCRMEQQKSAGSILVAVSVATLTFFKTGWAAFLLILTFLAKRAHPEATVGCTVCAGNESLEARVRELEHRLSLSGSAPNLGTLGKEG
ncbi:hypothetical protein FRB97_009623 [Tulasnella sp. 331]|nr:hypothetical protein FRB97_009623 [Tulasnella sp. 331]